ncbi:MAG: 4Fe-4S binding protein [Fusobacteriaceae bacterium]|jgi:NAD-dependent dihydropyrimidine dehydrogenase PreA subunit|nr:4Fe-4S binding protein [Fusobacteriaceae bacterium]
MKRQIIKINEELCNGCGACAAACHEGAIAMVDGKARLIRDDYCDGLGNCLPVCPTGAITFEEREAAAFDEKAVREKSAPLACGCPGTMARVVAGPEPGEACGIGAEADIPSELRQWPVQIRLVPAKAPYFEHADLLVAADCTAFAFGNFHREFLRGRRLVIGCPKLDPVDYAEKLTEIFKANEIRSVTVLRMEVPCCRGIEAAVREAIQRSGKILPAAVGVVSIEGEITQS